MNNNKLLCLFILFILFSGAAFAQTDSVATDYLSVTGPIRFDSATYYLRLSYHPAGNFYEQKYFPKGESVKAYQRMLLLAVVTSATTIEAAVATKVDQINKLKEKNPLVNYEVLEDTVGHETLIDFVVTESTADGKHINFAERNVYRYKYATDKSGKKCVLLLGASRRAYGDDIGQFFMVMKANRDALIEAVGMFAVPEVGVKE